MTDILQTDDDKRQYRNIKSIEHISRHKIKPQQNVLTKKVSILELKESLNNNSQDLLNHLIKKLKDPDFQIKLIYSTIIFLVILFTIINTFYILFS